MNFFRILKLSLNSCRVFVDTLWRNVTELRDREETCGSHFRHRQGNPPGNTAAGSFGSIENLMTPSGNDFLFTNVIGNT